MPFIPLNNLATYATNEDSPKLAVVINNKDPKQLARVKVQLPGYFEPEDDEGTNLPWVRQIGDAFLAGGNGNSLFSVPDIGSIVEIVWPFNKTTAFYKGCPFSENSKSTAFLNNYPYESGMQIGDLVIKFDKGTKSIYISNQKGFSITADATGEVTVSATSLTLESDCDLNIDAPNTIIEGNLSVNGSLETTDGASGIITVANIASVSNGIVTGIK